MAVSRFKPGVSGNPAGRPRGIPNKVTEEVRAAASELVDDPVYRTKLRADLRQRKVAPVVEQMLWYYAKGKPKERVEHSSGPVLDAELVRKLSDEDLAEVERLLSRLDQLMSAVV